MNTNNDTTQDNPVDKTKTVHVDRSAKPVPQIRPTAVRLTAHIEADGLVFHIVPPDAPIETAKD